MNDGKELIKSRTQVELKAGELWMPEETRECMSQLMGTPLRSMIGVEALNTVVLPKGEVTGLHQRAIDPTADFKTLFFRTEVRREWHRRPKLMLSEERAVIGGLPRNSAAEWGSLKFMRRHIKAATDLDPEVVGEALFKGINRIDELIGRAA